MAVAIVAGDREQPGIAKAWAEHHREMGYKVFIASSWPEDRLGEVYDGVELDGLCSVDADIPYNPAAGHGFMQLQRRVAVAVRLGGMALAFANPAVDTVVLADTDVQMLVPPEFVAELPTYSDAFALRLRFLRPDEAPYGWVCDLGLVIHRRGFDRLRRHLPMRIGNALAACGDKATVHGLLQSMLNMCNVEIMVERLEGSYLLPDGRTPALLDKAMPADAWLNFGHAPHAEGGTPYFVHVDMKTKVNLPGVTDPDYYAWAVRLMRAQLTGKAWKATLAEADLARIRLWQDTLREAKKVLNGAGLTELDRLYWQDWGAVQRAALHYTTHGTLPEAKTAPPLGSVTELNADTVRRVLRLA